MNRCALCKKEKAAVLEGEQLQPGTAERASVCEDCLSEAEQRPTEVPATATGEAIPRKHPEGSKLVIIQNLLYVFHPRGEDGATN